MQADPHTSSTVLLVRPAAFGFHPEAAETNAFASGSADAGVRAHAIREAERLARSLDRAGVEVLMFDDTPEPGKPDAVFPNNWISFHADGTVVVYPMATERRRLERNLPAVKALLGRKGFEVRQVIDLSAHEETGHFLEGTGSLILDRPGRRAFANRSRRTDEKVVAEFDRQLGFETRLFDAFGASGHPIYHTNVLLSLGTALAVLCAEVVPDEQRSALIADIEGTGRSVILVDYEQLRRFACNILELQGRAGEPVIAMSEAARKSFRPDQLSEIERFGTIVEASIPTIEAVGGGSVRCMIADVHLPRN